MSSISNFLMPNPKTRLTHIQAMAGLSAPRPGPQGQGLPVKLTHGSKRRRTFQLPEEREMKQPVYKQSPPCSKLSTQVHLMGGVRWPEREARNITQEIA